MSHGFSLSVIKTRPERGGFVCSAHSLITKHQFYGSRQSVCLSVYLSFILGGRRLRTPSVMNGSIKKFSFQFIKRLDLFDDSDSKCYRWPCNLESFIITVDTSFQIMQETGKVWSEGGGGVAVRAAEIISRQLHSTYLQTLVTIC